MKKILIFPFSNQLGTTIPTISLGNLLKKNGFEVIFAASGKYSDIIREKGFKVKYINEISYEQYREHTNDNNFDFYSKHLVRHLVEMEVDLIHSVSPDLIVHHNRQTVKISAKLTHKPLITLTVASLTNYYNFRYYIPSNHSISKIFPLGDVNKILPVALPKYVLHHSAKDWTKGFNDYLISINQTPIDSFFELSEGDITLLVETYGLVPLKSLPDSYHFLEQDSESSFGTKYSWFKDVAKYKKDGYKIIFVSMGSSSFNAYPLVMKNLADMVLNNPKKYILISNHCGLEYEYKDRKNFYIEKYLNPKDIFKYADIVITHGGKNTLNESLVSKKPVIGIPEQAEQLWNLKYIESQGLGKVISRFDLKKNSKILSDMIVSMLNDTSYKDNLDKFISKYIKSKDLIDHKSNLITAIKNL